MFGRQEVPLAKTNDLCKETVFPTWGDFLEPGAKGSTKKSELKKTTIIKKFTHQAVGKFLKT